MHRLFLGFDFAEFFAEVRRGFADLQPVEEGVRGFQPDAEPFRDFFFFLAFSSLHLAVVGDHFRAALAEASNFEHAFDGGFFAVDLESAEQFIEARDADLRVLKRLEMQDVLELFLETLFGFFAFAKAALSSPWTCSTSAMYSLLDFPASPWSAMSFRRSWSIFGGGPFLEAELASSFQDQLFFVCSPSVIVCLCGPNRRREIGDASVTGGSAGSPLRRR